MTLRSANLASAVRISSCTPSVKKAFSLSSLRLAKGSTAMLFSGSVILPDEVATDAAGEFWGRLLQKKTNATPTARTAAVGSRIGVKLERCFVWVIGAAPSVLSFSVALDGSHVLT